MEKIIKDLLNKYKSELQQETVPKLDKEVNERRLFSLLAKVEVLNELLKKVENED